MPVVPAAIEAIRARRTSNPKTVLGFYATVLGLLLSACVGAAFVLAETKTATYLIPWVLGFGALVFVMLVAGVFVITLTDPSKLMLGQITGSEYVAIHQAVLGDSLTGERLEVIDARVASSAGEQGNSTNAVQTPTKEIQ
jgi:hypothetical protein